MSKNHHPPPEEETRICQRWWDKQNSKKSSNVMDPSMLPGKNTQTVRLILIEMRKITNKQNEIYNKDRN